MGKRALIRSVTREVFTLEECRTALLLVFSATLPGETPISVSPKVPRNFLQALNQTIQHKGDRWQKEGPPSCPPDPEKKPVSSIFPPSFIVMTEESSSARSSCTSSGKDRHGFQKAPKCRAQGLDTDTPRLREKEMLAHFPLPRLPAAVASESHPLPPYPHPVLFLLSQRKPWFCFPSALNCNATFTGAAPRTQESPPLGKDSA